MPSKSPEISRLMVVSADVLPDVFAKVLEVKRLIARGEQKSSAAACKAVGISRSAYYKYKDSIFSYEEKLMQKIISLYAVLRDEPGVLSSVLAALHSLNANILTVNQNIPIDGVAAVTLSLRLNDVGEPYMLKSILSGIHGVVDVKIISGE
ncbi:MAG TPA: ACT domain-containing protein [Oscillospiraceae bacterium]|nr:hypothetical protein [Oscillospiraceae bacterium]HOV41498.1 ACT domain-containing protein [Oscillospiraceae bacterium]